MAGDIVDLSEIAFCERDYDSFYTEIKQNLQVLFGLRHPPVIRRHGQKPDIDRADSSDHVANEIFMTWNIDNADVKCFAVRSSEV